MAPDAEVAPDPEPGGSVRPLGTVMVYPSADERDGAEEADGFVDPTAARTGSPLIEPPQPAAASVSAASTIPHRDRRVNEARGQDLMPSIMTPAR